MNVAMRQEKWIGWLSVAHYAVGFALLAWSLLTQPFAFAILMALGVAVLGLFSAVAWLRGRRWAWYVLPLTYLPQIARVVAPDFNFWIDCGFKLFIGLGFEFGTIGLNLFALGMLIWSALAAAGKLDAQDETASEQLSIAAVEPAND